MTTNIPFKNLTHEEAFYNDLMCYGKAFRIISQRAWYNPMRWFKGKEYYRHIAVYNHFDIHR